MSNNISRQIHKLLRQTISVSTLSYEDSVPMIKDELQKDKPSMIARFGSTEIKAILYPQIPGLIKPFLKERIFQNMNTLSGFFPSTKENIYKFSEMMIEDMKLLDILGSWRMEERFLIKYFPNAKRIPLKMLEPYFFEDPWSQALEGKKVLVIHPFSETIESQYYNNRRNLFTDIRILPEFKSLETIKAVQTIAGNNGEFNDWFEALDSMKQEIDKKDFDIAIIGCGAYGFPLAAHVKRLGKKAVHLGGPTQILFGIKGKRWLEHSDFNTIINNYFVFPDERDKPKNNTKVEGGCYW